jgi:hypothetical protein
MKSPAEVYTPAIRRYGVCKFVYTHQLRWLRQ